MYTALLGAALVLGAVGFYQDALIAHPRAAAALACLTIVGCVTALCLAHPGRPISLGSMYMVLFGVFHGGLLLPIALGAAPRLLNPGDEAWAFGPYMPIAAVSVALASGAFTGGYLLHSRRAPRSSAVTVAASPVTNGSGAAGILGGAMLCLGVGVWYYNVLSSGVSVLGGSYGQFLSLTAARSMPSAYLLMGFGLALAGVSAKPWTRRWVWIVFVLFALPGFALGLRGEVIIPVAAYAIVAARRRRVRLRPWMAIVPVIGLSAGSVVRVARHAGFANEPITVSSFNPIDGLTELGYSLRPLIVTHQFHDGFHEPYVGMATYAAPFKRLIVGRLMGESVIPVGEDPTVFGTLMLQRVGPIGGSPAAEAYHAGGWLAVALVMFLLGLTASKLDSLPSSILTNSVVGMSAFILLLWVRNDFTPVLGQCIVLTVTLAAVWFLELRPVSARDRIHAVSP